MNNSSPCIGRLEHHIHDIFLSVRVPGEEFVYSPSPDLFNHLEDYCDDQGMNESKPPLLILGEAGSGKSALLANWLQRRQRNSARARITDEFIFWHAVGSSRQSTDVNALMRRLMVDLKSRFELSRDVSQSRERLCWDLPRFLDLASKKGKIIIVIDGLHRLNSHDGDAGLSWLPLEFPSNVRVVLSASAEETEAETSGKTNDDQSDNASKKPRIIMELERRHWQVLRLMRLDKNQTLDILESFLRKSMQSESTMLNSDPFLTSVADLDEYESKTLEGFVLFETQIDKILLHGTASSPFFLKTLLRCLDWAAARGYDLWALLDDWLASQTCNDLLDNILQTLEKGYQCTAEKRRQSDEFCVGAGGLDALRILYPWHPFFQKESTRRESTPEDDHEYSLENQRLKRQGILTSAPTQFMSAGGERHTVLSGTTIPPPANGTMGMGDTKWQHATEHADKRLNDIRYEEQREMTALVDRAKYEARKAGGGTSYIDIILTNCMKQAEQKSEMEAAASASSSHERNPHLSSANFIGDEFVFDGYTENKHDDDFIGSHGHDISHETDMYNSNKNSARSDSFRMRDSTAMSAPATASSMDPKNGLEAIPAHLRGGSGTIGFNGLLGQALSLLLVARNGLTETELWYLLSSMQGGDEETLERTQHNDDMRSLISVCYGYREHFLDVWKTTDLHITGRLSRGEILKGMRKIDSEFMKEDLLLLLRHLKVPDDNKIDYEDLYKKIVRKEKDYRISQLNHGKKSAHSSVSKFKSIDSTIMDIDFDEKDTSVNDGQSQVSLGAVMEEALLSALCALGVLYSPDNQVLVLPLESDALRQVVMARYVGAAGADNWHRRLIRYFEAQPNSLRRCEELPWHLQICRKWHSLKDTLADLNTFEMMYECELRDELLEYWVLLTEGTLYTSDAAQSEACSSRLQLSHNESIITALDTAAAMGFTEKEARKYQLRNQVANFDIVEEYNRSVESWLNSPNSSSQRLSTVLALISSFLVIYSRRPDHQPPPFIRMAVDMKGIEEFGVTYSKFGGVSLLLDALSLGGYISSKKDKFGNKDRSLLGGFSTLSRQDAQLYPYLRWIWMQFAWMALPRATTMKAASTSTIDSGVSIARGDDSNVEGDVVDIAYSVSNMHSKPVKSSDSLRKEYIHTRRFLAAKKTDPFLGPVVSVTENRKKAITRSAIRNSSLASQSMELVTKSNAEAITLLKPINKFRMPLEEEMAMLRSIPFCQPSLRSLHRGSRFPSAENLLKEKVFKEMDAKDSFSRTAPDRFGGQVPIVDMQEKIRRINVQEVIADNNIRHPGAIPAESEAEKLYDLEMDRIGRLRQLYDRAKEERLNRRKVLTDVKEKVEDRLNMDEKVTASLMMGEMAISGLETRHQSLMDALDEAKSLNVSYTKLIAFLEANPSYTQLHISAVEQQVELVKSQLKDLKDNRIAIYTDMERLDQLHESELEPKVAAIKEKRKGIQAKLKKQEDVNSVLRSKIEAMSVVSDFEYIRGDSNHSTGSTGHSPHSPIHMSSPLFAVAKLFAIGVTKHVPNNSINNNNINNNIVIESDGDEDMNASSARGQFETLLHRTGVASADEFLSRYKAAQRLHESLRSHQHLADSRLSNLRTESTELAAAWAHTQLVSRSDDPPEQSADVEREARYLDQKLFKLEMRSNQMLRQTEKLVLSINEIRSGVSHMASLLMSKKELLQKLPGHSEPPVGNSDEDITAVLSWCEDRVIAINEALVLDSSKPAATDDTQPFMSRQTQLAALVLANVKKGNAEVRSKAKVARKKVAGGMAQRLVFSDELTKESSLLASLGGVRILAKDLSEAQYETQVERAQKSREEIMSQKDLKHGQRSDTSVEELQGYLSDALKGSNSKHALRRANQSQGKSLGHGAGFGWALDEVVGKEDAESASVVGKGSQRSDSVEQNQVLGRAELKAMKAQRFKELDTGLEEGVDGAVEQQTSPGAGAAPVSRASNRH